MRTHYVPYALALLLACSILSALASGTTPNITAFQASRVTPSYQRIAPDAARRDGLGALLAADVEPLLPESLTICDAPALLPRTTGLGSYSPPLCIDYSGLTNQTYTLKIFLLERDTGSFFCASGQYCGSPPAASFSINNQSGTNSTGRLLLAQNMDVHTRTLFLWVVDLHNAVGTKVTSALLNANSTLNRAPVLGTVGNKNAVVGQSLDFVVTSTDAENDPRSLSAQNLPPGATFNPADGSFHWVPTAAGTFSNVEFVVTQTNGLALNDAELINIVVGAPPPAGEFVFSAADYKVGEAGPARPKVKRLNGSAGAVSVQCSTSDGSAASGADYSATTTTLNFADGETEKLFPVALANDTVAEPSESFQVTLGNPTGGATVGAQSSASVTIADDDTPAQAGQWSGLLAWPVVPIHVHLLPDGKVMFWDRAEEMDEQGNVVPGTAGFDGRPRIWNPAEPNTPPTLAAVPDWDIFCSGHTLTADGRLLVAGGHMHDFHGVSHASLYDPASNSWSMLPDMNDKRWYPTTTALANGDVLVLAGTRTNFGDINPLPQVWQHTTNTWRNLTGATMGALYDWPDYYPYMYLAPNGKLFDAGPQRTARYLDTAGTGSWTPVADSSLFYRDYGSSAMYDDGKVLIVGGNPRDPNALPSETAETINLNAQTPAWQFTAPMSVGRRHHNATLLPDGKVLVTGGTSAAGHDTASGKVLYPEMWDAATGSWTPLAAHTRYRGYHSTALLLPDGRVLCAGGGHPNPADGTEEKNAEIYSPPYLFKGARPIVTSAPASVTYGQSFNVQTPDAASIAQVNWIRLGSVTHAFNESQRINRLTFSQAAGGLSVNAPQDANLCPPGHYMLFILNGNGVPSVAKIVRITSAPAVSLTSPAGGASFNAPANIPLSANATDPDGSVARVDFYANSTFVGSDNSSPFEFNWSVSVNGSYSLTAVAIDDAGASATSAPVVVNVTGGHATAGLQYYPLARPVRLLDTRAGEPACDNPGTPLAAGVARPEPARVTCDGISIPAGALVIVGNATVVNNTGAQGGFVTLYPSGVARPSVSNLNYVPGQTVPNAFTVSLGADGAFNIYASTGVNFIVDITGYYAPPGAGGLYYHSLPRPVRLLDTRTGEPACSNPSAPLTGGVSFTQTAQGVCDGISIPASARALAGNATVVNNTGGQGGFVTLYSSDVQRPTASNLNYVAGQVIPNAFTVGLSSGGAFNIHPSSTVNFIVDITGYYSDQQSDLNGTGLLYYPLASPFRLLDTRAGEPACDAPGAPLTGGVPRPELARLTCNGITIPSLAQSVAGNATVVNNTGASGGFVTLYPNNVARPTVSNLNYVAGQVVPNAFTVGLGADGAFNIYASTGINFIADLTGYFAP